MRAIVLIIATVAFLGVGTASQASSVVSAELYLSFDKFTAQEWEGTPAPLQWDNTIFSKEVAFKRSSYEEMLSQSWRRFAGHYMVVDTACTDREKCGVVVNLKTGRIAAELPEFHYLYDWWPDSRLLVANPVEDSKVNEPDQYEDRVTYYYLFDGQNFVLLAKETWPDPVATNTKLSLQDLFGSTSN